MPVNVHTIKMQVVAEGALTTEKKVVVLDAVVVAVTLVEADIECTVAEEADSDEVEIRAIVVTELVIWLETADNQKTHAIVAI